MTGGANAGVGDFASCIAGHLAAYVEYREACGGWSARSSRYLRYFDLHCSRLFPGAKALTQEMVDTWCARRETETMRSCASRTCAARSFCAWAVARGLVAVAVPPAPKSEPKAYVPHAFTHDELARFFEACDSIDIRGRGLAGRLRAIACPAFFRLLYSSGIRTTEARLLKRSDVDLGEGVLDIRRSKGHDQHYVALHPTMTDVLARYDASAEGLVPGREWFFQSARGSHYSTEWVEQNFNSLWERANGPRGSVVPYDLRHNYAIENISSWDCDCFEAGGQLLWLSRSMGHRKISSTLYYYSMVPRLSDKLLALTGDGMDDLIPAPWEEVPLDG